MRHLFLIIQQTSSRTKIIIFDFRVKNVGTKKPNIFFLQIVIGNSIHMIQKSIFGWVYIWLELLAVFLALEGYVHSAIETGKTI